MSLLVYLVTQYDWFSLLFFRAPSARVIQLLVTGCVFALPRAPARAHYFAHYLTVTVKIRTLESIFPV